METGSKIHIETDRRTIAERTLQLRGKPFSLDSYPPWQTIYEIDSRKIVVLSGRQVAKCCPETAQVLRSDGRLSPMASLQVGDEVCTLTPQHRLVPGRVVNTFALGPRRCLRLHTRMGHRLEVAATHPVKMLYGYVPAGELVVGSRIAAVRQAGMFTGRSDLSPAAVTALAYMIGDGSMGHNDNFGFINSNPLLVDDYLAACQVLGETRWRIYDRKGSQSVRMSFAKDGALRRLIERVGLWAHTSETKFVPEEVFQLDRERTALFLNRLWACDGTVKVRAERYDVCYGSISERLIRGVQALLWKFGIPTSIRFHVPKVYERTDKRAWVLRVETQEGIRRFLREVGARGKSEQVPEPTVAENNNRDTIPIEIQDVITHLHETCKRRGTLMGKGRKRGRNLGDYGLRGTLKYALAANKLRRYVEVFAACGVSDDPAWQFLDSLIEADVIWDEVEAIEELGELDCFDIEVAGWHNYVLDGVVTHNSTAVAAFGVSEGIGEPYWESLTVHPSLIQSRRFSNQRVASFINDSPEIRRWFIDSHCRRNTGERSFINGSVMYFGATSQLESLRGLSANRVFEDEIQDMVGDELAIIEEVMSGQPSAKQFVMRTGTAKTVGNTLEETWRKSTMCEWVVPCPSGHWNLPSTDNIGDRGFTCKSCKAVCDVRQGRWYATAGHADKAWSGFRIPQIVLPMHTEDAGKWQEILRKYHGGSDPNTFLNEVMGVSAGSGVTLLSEDDLKACCDPGYQLMEQLIPDDMQYHFLMAGIDWGLTARRSYTVLSIFGLTVDNRLRLIFAKRFLEPDVLKQVDEIASYCTMFTVDMVGADWGAGVAQSRLLEQKLRRPVQRFMYVSEQHEMVRWDDKAQIYKTNRTQAMTETFVKMRRKQFWFPEWNQFRHYASDILCIFEERLDDRNNNDKFKYDHPEDSPDDFMHTCVYANMLLHLAQTGGMRY
jgi:intein/homing endonuclease